MLPELASGETPPELASGETPPELASGETPPELASGETLPELASGETPNITVSYGPRDAPGQVVDDACSAA